MSRIYLELKIKIYRIVQLDSPHRLYISWGLDNFHIKDSYDETYSTYFGRFHYQIKEMVSYNYDISYVLVGVLSTVVLLGISVDSFRAIFE